MKNSKFAYYADNFLKYLLPNRLFCNRLEALLGSLDTYDAKYIAQRVDYYIKRQEPFAPDTTFQSIKDFSPTKKSAYFFDLFGYLRYFDSNLRVKTLFGDIKHVPEVPAVVKSRPIEGDNANSVLLKLNKIRHFVFVKDRHPFAAKKDLVVWRGAAYKPHRIAFVKKFYNHPLCDVGQTNNPRESVPWQKPRMSIEEQLRYKFIFSIEGNDVATNLKWIMSSNSLVFMQKPKFETWFMEGRLVPGLHYVLINEDFSDLEEKVHYYGAHTDEALAIVHNAQEYVKQFTEEKREELIALLVLKKYFELSGQLPAEG